MAVAEKLRKLHPEDARCDRCGGVVAVLAVFEREDADAPSVLALCNMHLRRHAEALRAQADSCYAFNGQALW